MPKGLITVQGDKRLLRLYKNLNVTHKQHVAITRKAGNIVKTWARKKIPVGPTGNLKDSLVVKASKNYGGVWVGPNYGRFGGAANGSHFHLVYKKFMRSHGKISTHNPMGNVMQEAAAEQEGKIKNTLAKGYGSLLKRKLRKF